MHFDIPRLPDYIYEVGHTENCGGPQEHTSLGLFVKRVNALRALRFHKREMLKQNIENFYKSRVRRVRRDPETTPCYEYIKNEQGKYTLHSSNELLGIEQPYFEGPLSLKGFLRQYRPELHWWIVKRELN